MFSQANRALISTRLLSRDYGIWIALACGIAIPLLYLGGFVSIDTVNMMGRYLALALVAISLDLVWGYTGMLCLCQSFFFALGGYAMGMYLAHHGGPEGIVDSSGWKIPACLYVVYPYGVGEAPGDALTPWFWKPFFSLPGTLFLGLAIPGFVAFVIGFFVFRSRVRGVFFAVLTQAVTLAAWLVFCMNDMKLCGTNGLTRFDRMAGFQLSDSKTRLGLYVITLVLLALVYGMCSFIIRSRLGRVLVAIRDNETRLRFAGYKPHLFKIFIFSVSAMIAGLGGMLYAPQMGIFTPTNMEVRESILVVIWVAVGGRGTLGGAIAGTLLVNLFYSFLTSRQEFFWFLEDYLAPATYEKLVWTPDYWPFVLGGLFIIVVLYLPDGIASLWSRWSNPRTEVTG
ncbi:MAG: urea ABC transporter permease subunit UrtC [Pirellulaceae bacterium]|nr:urea ABC transporter permease subunit UrtC [Pirellulaceae bacterium]